MATVRWGEEIAAVYDVTSAAMFDPAVLDPTDSRRQVAVYESPRR